MERWKGGKNVLTSPKQVKQMLEQHGLDARKRFGQNFLIDQNILSHIIEAGEIEPNEGVLEIGPGLGTMTVELAKRAGQLLAVEIDSDLIDIVQKSVGAVEEFRIINQDILKVDLQKDVMGWFKTNHIKVIANLPYYITTPILMRLLESHIPIECIVVMIQKEVGDRICAEPGSKQYGALSLAIQTRMDVSTVCKVPASAFYPAPNVDSMVVKLQRRNDNLFARVDETLFFKIVKAGFLKRRKTLLNALSSENIHGLDKKQIEKILTTAKIDPKRRAETLSIEEFKQITCIFSQYTN